MIERVAIFSCMGLGDGLISLVLAHNLAQHGRKVTLFHPILKGMESWFPYLNIRPFPEHIETFDHYYIFHEKSPWMAKVEEQCTKEFPEKTLILNPIATEKRDYPWWENGRFDGTQSFVDNLQRFCNQILYLTPTTKSNGITIPPHVVPFRFPKRVIIHPTSSRPGKNWPPEKYIELAHMLQKKGFEPVFILTESEKKTWPASDIPTPQINSLDALAAYVCESGYMIGNDSGVGHLASCLGIPTLTICRNRKPIRFWRPSWAAGIIVTPPAWIPNIKGIRWRDQHWQKLISADRVLHSFLQLSKIKVSL